MNRWWNE